jgi:two-component system, NarL family, response regulator LiaR
MLTWTSRLLCPSGHATAPGTRCSAAATTQNGSPPGERRVSQPVVFGDEGCAQVERPCHGLVGVRGLEVEVHARHCVHLLQMHVRGAVRRLEAAQLRMSVPGRPEGPVERQLPEGSAGGVLVLGDVDDGMDPAHAFRVTRAGPAYAGRVTAGSGRPLRIAIVDDYEIVVAGIAALLAPYEDRVRVVELDTTKHPHRDDLDVILLDTFGHPHEVDIDELTSHGARLVVFSWNLEPERIAGAIAQGASGYLAKSTDAAGIVSALERVHAGELVVPPLAAESCSDATVGWPGREHGFSHREAEVMALIAQGLTNQEIAARLYLSINSVKTYVRTAYRKIDVTRRSQAVAWALSHGFIAEPSQDRVDSARVGR